MTDRVSNWRQNYDAFTARAQYEPFRWGEHDCVMFAAKALDVQYDLGLVALIESEYHYDDESTALKLIAEFGTLENLVTLVLGVEPLPPAHLTTGDIALYDYVPAEGWPHALAVHDGHQLLAPIAVGLRNMPLGLAVKGWRP